MKQLSRILIRDAARVSGESSSVGNEIILIAVSNIFIPMFCIEKKGKLRNLMLLKSANDGHVPTLSIVKPL